MKWRERWLQFTGDNPEVVLSLDGYRAKLFWSLLHDSFNSYHETKYAKKVANHKRRYGPSRK